MKLVNPSFVHYDASSEVTHFIPSRVMILSVLDGIGLVQDRYRWRALVNSVMNLWVP
jgi:hypothetical protein